MEKPSGLKECPRCGLRNRAGAYQCEFCGWDFGVASDDWMGQINYLERLGKDIDAPSMDKSTASKIELTRKKPSEYPVPEKRLEAAPEPTLIEEPELGDTAAAKPAYQDDAHPDVIIAEAVPEPYAETTPEAPARTAKAPVVEAAVKAEATAAALPTMPLAIDAAILVAGGAGMAAALGLVTSGSLDRAVGWVPTIIGAFLVVLAISRLLALREKIRGVPAESPAPASRDRSLRALFRASK